MQRGGEPASLWTYRNYSRQSVILCMDLRARREAFILPKPEPPWAGPRRTVARGKNGHRTSNATAFTWDIKTGANITKSPRRKLNEDEKHSVLVRRAIGACFDCRKSKRRVSRIEAWFCFCLRLEHSVHTTTAVILTQILSRPSSRRLAQT